MFDGNLPGKDGDFHGLMGPCSFQGGSFRYVSKAEKNSEGSGGFSRERWEVQPQGAEPRDDDDDDSGGYVGQGIQIHQDPLNSGAFSNNGKLGGGNSNIFYVHFGEDFQFDYFFFKGVETTNYQLFKSFYYTTMWENIFVSFQPPNSRSQRQGSLMEGSSEKVW